MVQWFWKGPQTSFDPERVRTLPTRADPQLYTYWTFLLATDTQGVLGGLRLDPTNDTLPVDRLDRGGFGAITHEKVRRTSKVPRTFLLSPWLWSGQPGRIEDDDGDHAPEDDAGEERPVAQDDLFRRAALVLLVDQVEVAEDGVDDEGDGQHHQVVVAHGLGRLSAVKV